MCINIIDIYIYQTKNEKRKVKTWKFTLLELNPYTIENWKRKLPGVPAGFLFLLLWIARAPFSEEEKGSEDEEGAIILMLFSNMGLEFLLTSKAILQSGGDAGIAAFVFQLYW